MRIGSAHAAPLAAAIVVVKGDTLYSIAFRHGRGLSRSGPMERHCRALHDLAGAELALSPSVADQQRERSGTGTTSTRARPAFRSAGISTGRRAGDVVAGRGIGAALRQDRSSATNCHRTAASADVAP